MNKILKNFKVTMTETFNTLKMYTESQSCYFLRRLIMNKMLKVLTAGVSLFIVAKGAAFAASFSENQSSFSDQGQITTAPNNSPVREAKTVQVLNDATEKHEVKPVLIELNAPNKGNQNTEYLADMQIKKAETVQVLNDTTEEQEVNPGLVELEVQGKDSQNTKCMQSCVNGCPERQKDQDNFLSGLFDGVFDNPPKDE